MSNESISWWILSDRRDFFVLNRQRYHFDVRNNGVMSMPDVPNDPFDSQLTDHLSGHSANLYLPKTDHQGHIMLGRTMSCVARCPKEKYDTDVTQFQSIVKQDAAKKKKKKLDLLLQTQFAHDKNGGLFFYLTKKWYKLSNSAVDIRIFFNVITTYLSKRSSQFSYTRKPAFAR